MVYSLFDQDEKDKITESFNSLGIPTGVSVSESQQSTDDVALQNKALEDIIARQQKDEQAIKDDYDSLGSRANRFLQVFGAGLRGENTSQVAKDLRDNLNTRLTNIRSKYKDDRDAAYQRVKDTLARREALAKAEYDRSRDAVKDSQADRDYNLRAKTQADQNAIQQAQLDILRGQNAAKEAEAQKVAEAESQKVLKDKVNTDLEISQLFSNGTMNPTGGVFGGDNDLKGGKLDDVVIKLVQKRYGIAPKDYQAFKKANPDIVPNKDEDAKIIKLKLKNLGHNPVVKTTSPDPDGNQIVEFEDGSKVIYNAIEDRYTEVE